MTLLWEPLMISHHPAKFGSYGHFGSGDIIMLLVCHVNQKGLLTVWIEALQGKSTSCQVWWP